jgi:putative transposase
MDIKEELLDELMKNYQKPEDMLGENGILAQLKKRLINKVLTGEMNHHLGYEKNSPKGNLSGNSRNGKYKKTIKDDNSEFEINVPRDREGTFEPQMIPKGVRRFNGFDENVLSMYSRGMTTREIQGHLKELYTVDVSADLISTVTNEVMEEVKEWQSRPLDSMYPIVYLDAIRVKIRDAGTVYNKAVYLAIGVNTDGLKEVLGIWVTKNEGAKFWLHVITDIKNRGVKDILIACVDGLKGFPEAIESVFPNTEVQLCIVHMIRNSLKFVSYKDKRVLANDLKTIYKASTKELAKSNLDSFKEKWDAKFPMISKSWDENWDRLSPFFDYTEDIRRVIYTTNAIESLNYSLRKVTKSRSSFPNDSAAIKLLYLALKNISKKWTMPIKDWGSAINQLSIKFEGRISIY